MMSMVTDPKQGETLLASPPLASVGSQKLQPMQFPLDLLESFGDRLHKAVTVANGTLRPVVGNSENANSARTSLLSKTGNSPAKKFLQPLLVSSTYVPAQSQPPNIDLLKSAAEPFDSQTKTEEMETLTPKQATSPATVVSETDQRSAVDTVAERPLQVIPSNVSVGNERAVIVAEKPIPTASLKSIEASKATQSDKAGTTPSEEVLMLVAADARPVSPIDLQFTIVTIVPDGAAREIISTVALQQNYDVNKLEGRTVVGGTLNSMQHGLEVANDSPASQLKSATPGEDLKLPPRSVTDLKSMPPTNAGQGIKNEDLHCVAEAISIGVHERLAPATQISNVTFFAGLQKPPPQQDLVPQVSAPGEQIHPGYGPANGLSVSPMQDTNRLAETNLNATANTLEVGISNGAHGWLKVRAEMENGLITASLSSGSASGREMLHRELPSLTAFLQQEKIGVSALVVKEASTSVFDRSCSGSGTEPNGRPGHQQSGAECKNSVEADPGNSIDADASSADKLPQLGPPSSVPEASLMKGGWLNIRV